MFAEVFERFAEGFGYTVGLFAVTLVAAIPLGIVVALCSITKFKPIRWLTKVFIWVVRGTPLLLQIIVVTFIPSTVFLLANKDLADFFGVSIVGLNFIFAAVAFIINYSAYFAEIFRGGIEGIPRGQHDRRSSASYCRRSSSAFWRPSPTKSSLWSRTHRSRASSA